MYPLTKAIFDNTVFNNIVRIQSADLSNVFQSLIQEVLVPQTVVAEMEDWAQSPVFAARIGYFTSQIRLHSTYFLIALAYFQSLLPNADAVLQEFHQIMQVEKMKSSTQRAYKAILRREATEALKVLGFPFDKKQISFLTALKTRI